MNGPLNWSSLVKFESQVRSISGRMRLVNTNLMKIKTVLGVTNYSFKRRMRLLRNELKTAESNLAKVEAKFKTAVDLGSDILQRLSSNSQLNGGETSSEVNPRRERKYLRSMIQASAPAVVGRHSDMQPPVYVSTEKPIRNRRITNLSLTSAHLPRGFGDAGNLNKSLVKITSMPRVASLVSY
ncbi:hypothetical protein LSH36_58g19036 [Paralvinella palmiformis]|uniref:Uncharacterized protein n=1 Tax=Paralvinella palmiformis TaxID=53620 RepID=A0AAD9K4M6_9ANNE|nr:hypothetical protein LSH36_58g19036 [Paralvinella palmiformis]